MADQLKNIEEALYDISNNLYSNNAIGEDPIYGFTLNGNVAQVVFQLNELNDNIKKLSSLLEEKL